MVYSLSFQTVLLQHQQNYMFYNQKLQCCYLLANDRNYSFLVLVLWNHKWHKWRNYPTGLVTLHGTTNTHWQFWENKTLQSELRRMKSSVRGHPAPLFRQVEKRSNSVGGELSQQGDVPTEAVWDLRSHRLHTVYIPSFFFTVLTVLTEPICLKPTEPALFPPHEIQQFLLNEATLQFILWYVSRQWK